MAQDFAKKKNSSPRKSAGGSSAPGWVWLLTGAISGAFVTLLFYLYGVNPQKPDSKSSPKTQQTATNVDQTQKNEKPTFEFYDSLKNNEIIPPGDATKNNTSSNAALKTPYMLQVASFQKAKDADALKAKLILEGLDTSIQQFNNKSETRYRVIVGPFTDQHKMNDAKTKLAQHNLTPIVLQKKPN